MQNDQDQVMIGQKILKNFQVSRVHKVFNSSIRSLDYSDDGRLLIACDQTSMVLFDADLGSVLKRFNNKSILFLIVKFTHSQNIALVASEIKNKIIVWDLQNDLIIQSIQAHDLKICSLKFHPTQNSFISTAEDQKLKIWNHDIDSGTYINNSYIIDICPECSIIQDFALKTYAEFDPSGMVIAASYIEQDEQQRILTVINLYDFDKLEESYFERYKIYDQIIYFQYSSDGKYILCNSIKNNVLVIDAFEGSIKARFNQNLFQNEQIYLYPSFVPNSQNVLQGGSSGEFYVYDINTNVKDKNQNQIIKIYEQNWLPVSIVKHNPVYCQIVSACKNLILWKADLVHKN